MKKLKSLVYRGFTLAEREVPLLPSMETLEMHDYSDLIHDPLFAVPLPMPTRPLLRRLVFMEVDDLFPASITKIIQVYPTSNLGELIIDRCGSWAGCTRTTQQDFDTVILARERHTPHLKSLRWTAQDFGVFLWTSFKGLIELRKLHVHMATLVFSNDHDLDAQPKIQTDFPDSLQDLAIDDIYIDEAKSLIREPCSDIENGGNLDRVVSMGLLQFASKHHSLHRLVLSLMMHHYLAPNSEYGYEKLEGM